MALSENASILHCNFLARGWSLQVAQKYIVTVKSKAQKALCPTDVRDNNPDLVLYTFFITRKKGEVVFVPKTKQADPLERSFSKRQKREFVLVTKETYHTGCDNELISLSEVYFGLQRPIQRLQMF